MIVLLNSQQVYLLIATLRHVSHVHILCDSSVDFPECSHTRVNIFRVKFVAARDGLLPSFLCGIHNTYNTPLPAVVVSVSNLYYAIYLNSK